MAVAVVADVLADVGVVVQASCIVVKVGDPPNSRYSRMRKQAAKSSARKIVLRLDTRDACAMSREDPRVIFLGHKEGRRKIASVTHPPGHHYHWTCFGLCFLGLGSGGFRPIQSPNDGCTVHQILSSFGGTREAL